MAIISENRHWYLHDKVGKKRWSIEASDLQNNQNERGCPVCSKEITFGFGPGQMAPVKDGEGDLTWWAGTCSCGVELIIFND